MRKFILSGLILSILVALVIGLIVAYRILIFSPEVEKVYVVGRSQDVLFIGSSQTACSIAEASCYHNKLLCVYSAAPNISLFRLLELERRQQLKNVKTCYMEFSPVSFKLQRGEDLAMSWLRELPISWRYTKRLPCSIFDLISRIAENVFMRFCINMEPIDRPSLSTKTEEQINEHVLRAKKDVLCDDQYLRQRGWCRGWEHALLASVMEMKRVCDRNHIRFVLWSPPMTALCYTQMPSHGRDLYDRLIAFFNRRGVEFVDMRRSVEDDMRFYDLWHLDSDSVVYFTNLFYEKNNIAIGSSECGMLEMGGRQ